VAPPPFPDPSQEIRLRTLQALRGANYWSRRPVTRLDIAPGAYDEISSADVPHVAQALVAALPGLVEHRCSIGERGGFVTRLTRGTYAPHIIEHDALELQMMVGHEVGYGKTRGGDAPGEYTVIVEHHHSGVGLRAAALALGITQRAFAGTLGAVEHALLELRALAESPDLPAVRQHVMCGITGGAARHETRDEMVARGFDRSDLLVEVAPGYILQAGLPYSRSELAVVLDAAPTDVPDRYRAPDRARALVSVVADAVRPGGIVIAPAKEWDVQDRARDAGCRVAIFATDDNVTARDEQVAHSVALVHEDRIVLEGAGVTADGGVVRGDAPIAAQVAAALAVFTLHELEPELAMVP
jgi:cyanophycin synthetase